MMEQATQAINDGEAEAGPTTKPSAVMLRIAAPVELAEYLFMLIIWNAGPRIPDFDPQISAALASADQNTAAGGVPDRVGHQIEKDLLQEHEVTANPCVSWNNSKVQAAVPCGACERRLDPLEQLGHGKFGDVRSQRAGVEPGNIEERLEQLIHHGDRGIDALNESLPLGGGRGGAKLRNEQPQGMQRLSQIVARRRQKPGFCRIGELELMGPLLDLAFERRVGILELRRHAIELFAQRLQFVAGLYADLLVEVAPADARGTIMQGADRYGHSTGEIEARECRQYESRNEQRRGSLNRGVKRRIGLTDRQFDKDQPAERPYRSMHAQHGPALDVVRHRWLLGWRRRAFSERRLDLREPRHVRIAKHHADVRMSDQPAGRIHHISAPTD